MTKVHWSEYRPATQIEIAMVFALSRLHLTPNRERFVTRIAANYKFAGEQGDRRVITDKQASFLARCVWRYRKHIEPSLVLAAALKGGLQTSPWQRQAAERAAEHKLRTRYIEDPRQLELIPDEDHLD